MKFVHAQLVVLGLIGAAVPASRLLGPDADALVARTPLAQPLAEAVPIEHAGWTGRELDLNEVERERLDVDDYVNRVYTNAAGDQIGLFITYQGNKQRGLRSYYHNASVCYPAQGYAQQDTQISELVLTDVAQRVPTCRYTFEKGRDRRLVLTFFKVDDEFLQESPRNRPFWVMAEKFESVLDDSPGTFAQVQVIAAVGPDGDAAASTLQREFLQQFGRVILEAID